MKHENTIFKILCTLSLMIILSIMFIHKANAQTGSGTAAYFCCDSITYTIDPSQGFNISLDTTNIVHNPDSIEVWWAVCTNGLCYSGQGMYDYFPQVMTTDTVKVCYDVYLYEANMVEGCTRCDTVIFDGTNWVLFSMGNPTGIEELVIERFNDNKVYDLIGREVINLTKGVMYIRNNQKFIIVE